MRGCFTMMAAAMLLPLSVTAADAEAPSTVVQCCPVCTELLDLSQQIDRILRSVSDRESADKAADELKGLLQRMQNLCVQLETLPVSTPEEARMLSDSMRTLTHIFQSYIPVVERLMEVNAYGSEKLVNVFNLYKVRDGYGAVQSQEESPRVLAWQEVADSLEEVLYHVRKLNTAAEVNQQMPRLREAVQRVEQRLQVTQSEGYHHEMPASCRTQMSALYQELRTEMTRLSGAGLLTAELADLLKRCHQ